MLGSRLARFHREFMQPPRFVFYVFAAAEPVNRQPHGLVERPRLHFDRVLDPFGILKRDPALLHPSRIPYSPFLPQRFLGELLRREVALANAGPGDRFASIHPAVID
jgi:hypothetical protein